MMDAKARYLPDDLWIGSAAPQHQTCWCAEVRQNFRQIDPAHSGQFHICENNAGRIIPHFPQGIVCRIERLHLNIACEPALQGAQFIAITWNNHESVRHEIASLSP
jgi:hypothetical protein